jgi:hypothetical protein
VEFLGAEEDMGSTAAMGAQQRCRNGRGQRKIGRNSRGEAEEEMGSVDDTKERSGPRPLRYLFAETAVPDAFHAA